MNLLMHQILAGPRHRRHLRQRRAGAGDDLPGDPPGELRAGRDGDVLDLPRLGADPGRRALLGARSRSPSSVAFVLGVVIERVIIRPVENAPILAVVIVFIALLVIFNSLAGWIFSYTIKPFPSPFPAAAAVRQPVRLVARARLDRRSPWSCCCCSSSSSASRRSAWRCARRRRTRSRAGWSASASAGCSRSAGAWRRRSARSPG